MDFQALKKRPPRRKDDRIIFHFDYDCFYASVFEHQNPALKSLPLGVKQKSILATCNYVARARGVKKLMLISDAKVLCPDLVIIEGEDLTPFRDMSKTLWSFLKSHSWNQKVERLGLDEVFMDVTDIINYNMTCVNRGSLAASFFHLSKQDPEKGFACDLTQFAGCVYGTLPETPQLNHPSYVKLLLASHLALYLRQGIEENYGFTCTCGVSSNKLLSKLVGSQHKPQNQTTFLALDDGVAVDFIDTHTIRKIPGIGSKMTQHLEQRILSSHTKIEHHDTESPLTARDVRTHNDIHPDSLETILGGPGSEQGVGVRVWNMLHGVDYTEVKDANDVPSQISIEDTYRGLSTLPRIETELKRLSMSLIRRMRLDLTVLDATTDEMLPDHRWLAYPKTLRLSIRAWPPDSDLSNWDFSRTSRSQRLPNFVFNLKDSIEALAERLTSEVLFPMLKRFEAEKTGGWNLQLMNICAANMLPGGSETGPGIGRDISSMFKKQDEVLKQWKADTTIMATEESPSHYEALELDSDEQSADVAWEADEDAKRCSRCGHFIPHFAALAHARYHDLDE